MSEQQFTESDGLRDLSNDEAAAVDFYMSEHMYRHQISNSYAGMSCNSGCRTQALANAINRRVLAPRREAQQSNVTTPPAPEHRLIGSMCSCGGWLAQCGNDVQGQWLDHVRSVTSPSVKTDGGA